MPEERDGLVRTAELHRRTGAEMEHVAIDLDQSDLLLSRPIWKQADVHFVLERLLGLVDMKGARIGDVAAVCSDVFAAPAAVHVATIKISTIRRAFHALDSFFHRHGGTLEIHGWRTLFRYARRRRPIRISGPNGGLAGGDTRPDRPHVALFRVRQQQHP